MIHIATLTIPAGQSVSNILDGHRLRWLRAISIHPPAALTGVTTVQVSPKSERDNRKNPTHSFQDLQSDGADVTLTADKVLVINEVPLGSLRLETTAAPAGDEVYEVVGHDDPGF